MSIGQTLRWAVHLRPSQIFWRLLRRTQRRFLKMPSGHAEMPVCFPADPWPGNAENGKRIADDGVIRLLNLEHALAAPIDWTPQDKDALWRFTLNYFEWLADLKAADRPQTARDMILDWIAGNRDPRKETWHPYPLSLRLFAWLRFAPWILEGSDQKFERSFLSSLDAHADLLARMIEYDVGGNHLIKNLKGLIAAAACLPSHAHLRDRWMTALKEQIDEQILPDGFHYERSPSYHLQVLIDLIDISDLLDAPPAWLSDAILRMLPALSTMRHPDGGLALFNDGDVGDPKLLGALDSRFGKPAPHPMLPDAGYARLEVGDMVVIFDAGLCCPDHLTAHAHADTLSFEMSVGKERVIVNGGTYAYQDPLRNHFRGTAAHSTIMVNNEDCAEVFGTFRLGRRPKKAELFWDGDWLVGRHDGYRHLGVTVERRLRLTEEGLEGRDRLLGNNLLHFGSAFISMHNTNFENHSMYSLALKHNGGFVQHKCKLAPTFFNIIDSEALLVYLNYKPVLADNNPEGVEAHVLRWTWSRG
ncbi:MAG: heparinase II/III family protein [Alphaproteobacteria bacterium]|nr:heparinase II/III family protein [Alphaproteobacteria bacterium]